MNPLPTDPQLPDRWPTRRLLIADSMPEEIPTLTTLWNETCASGVGQFEKNWPALRFWSAAGLRHIHLIRGDRHPAPDAQASVILEGALHDMASDREERQNTQ
jgi:hypothetical protein